MRTLEKEVDLSLEQSWFQWEDCSDAAFDTIESLAYKRLPLDDFMVFFNQCSEEERNSLLFKNSIWEHQNIVYFVSRY